MAKTTSRALDLRPASKLPLVAHAKSVLMIRLSGGFNMSPLVVGTERNSRFPPPFNYREEEKGESLFAPPPVFFLPEGRG